MDFEYFGDNYVALHVSSNRGNIDIEIEFPRYEDEELEGIDEVIDYLKSISERYSVFNWIFE
jgi:hypothetical protein